MSFRLCCLSVFSVVSALGASVLVATQGAAKQAAAVSADPPRLVVLVVVDQLRGDYLTRWQHLYRAGLKRLQTDGAWYVNCHYPYAGTTTAAGHASMVTGCPPAVHGIVANRWFDRSAFNDKGTLGMVLESVDVQRPYRRIAPGIAPSPPSPPGPEGRPDFLPLSPERMLAQPVADALKEATNWQARVVALAVKDRSAILPGGRYADACYWIERETGLFVTTDFYQRFGHRWVAEVNAARPADKAFGGKWERWRAADVNYDAEAGPDDVKGEGYKDAGLFPTFPHALDGGLKRSEGQFLDGTTSQPVKNGKRFYEALSCSPWGNDVLYDLALKAIDAEQLGVDATPDLLCVSFSANDLAGHAYGPDSHEVLDMTLRFDDLLGKFLGHLDQHVGVGKYLVALTADHGVSPLPELAAQGKGLYTSGDAPAARNAQRLPLVGSTPQRVKPKTLRAKAEAVLNLKYPELAKKLPEGKAIWTEADPDDFWIYLNRSFLRASGLDFDAVAEALADGMRKLPEVLTTYTRKQMLSGLPADDVLGQRLRLSFHPERSGDVAILLQPYHPLWDSETGTSHGTPYAYDTHVPLVVLGAGVKKGLRMEPVTPLATAAILAHALRIPPPASARAPVPPGLFTRD